MRKAAVLIIAVLTGLLIPLPTASAARTINVAPGGSDQRGTGSASAPYATIARALKAATAGDTIQLASGTYREGELAVRTSVSIVEAPGATAILDGSEIVDGWRANGDGSWTSTRTDLVRFCDECTANTNPADEGMARFPEQVFLDGQPLRQVATREELTQGTFWVNDPDPVTTVTPGNNSSGYRVKPHRGVSYVLGSDPQGHTVEITQHARALTLSADGIRWDGIDVRRFSPVQEWRYQDPQIADMSGGAMVMVSGKDVRVANSVLSHSAAAPALFLGGAKRAVVENNSFENNGGTGLGVNLTDGATIQGNRWTLNNRAGFKTVRCGAACVTADTKVTSSTAINYVNNTHDYSSVGVNHADPNVTSNDRLMGVWFDDGVIGSTIVGNHFRNQGRDAIFVEVSSNNIVASNIVESSFRGIRVRGADTTKIYNNTIVDSLMPLIVEEEDRTNGCSDLVDGQCGYVSDWAVEHDLSWNVSGTEVYNNVFGKATVELKTDPWVYVVTVRVDGLVNSDGTRVFANDMIAGIDNNVYYRAREGVRPYQVHWNYAEGQRVATSRLSDLSKDPNVTIARKEQNGQAIVAPRDQQTMFVSLDAQESGLAGNDLHPRSGGPLDGRGTALPADVATALGVPAGQPVDVGALTNVAWQTTRAATAEAAPAAATQAPSTQPTPAPATTAPATTATVPAAATSRTTTTPKSVPSKTPANPKRVANQRMKQALPALRQAQPKPTTSARTVVGSSASATTKPAPSAPSGEGAPAGSGGSVPVTAPSATPSPDLQQTGTTVDTKKDAVSDKVPWYRKPFVMMSRVIWWFFGLFSWWGR